MSRCQQLCGSGAPFSGRCALPAACAPFRLAACASPPRAPPCATAALAACTLVAASQHLAYHHLISTLSPLFNSCSGGLELLFGKVKRFDVDVPEGASGGLTVGGLIAWMAANLLKERPELFISGDTV